VPEAECAEDRFGGVNSSARGARELVGGVWPLAFCTSSEDWFAITVEPGHGLAVDVAFSTSDADLELEMLEIVGQDMVTVASDLGFQDGAHILFNNREGVAKLYYIRIYEAVAPGADPIPMRYGMRLQLFDHAVCREDWHCELATEICNAADLACEPRDCRENVVCAPDQVCNDDTGICDEVACVVDQFGGTNSELDQAAAIEVGTTYEDLTICEGERDWYSVELEMNKCLHVTATFEVPLGELAYDIDLGLYGPDGFDDLLGMGMRRGEDNEELWWNLEGSGTHYIEAAHALTNTYDLIVEVTDGLCEIPCDNVDYCMLFGLNCDLELGQCVPF